MNSPYNTINELRLPDALIQAIASGRWQSPEVGKLYETFPLERVVQPEFYSIEYMRIENSGWIKQTLVYFLGKQDLSNPPGDLDPTQSLLIADLGPDQPIALDYRKSHEKPSVVYLTGSKPTCWIEVAPDIETLLSLLY